MESEDADDAAPVETLGEEVREQEGVDHVGYDDRVDADEDSPAWPRAWMDRSAFAS